MDNLTKAFNDGYSMKMMGGTWGMNPYCPINEPQRYEAWMNGFSYVPVVGVPADLTTF